jgi:hypothetical protein
VQQAPTGAAFPWTLRLVHEGHSSIRVERAGRWFRFDPYEPPDPDHQSILTWNEAERAQGLLTAVREAKTPRVVAHPDLLGWLQSLGPVHPGGDEIEGVRVEMLEYEPVPYATPSEFVRKTRAALLSPGMAARRLYKRASLPKAQPVIVQLTFPDGRRLLHLNCSLHQWTPADWLDEAVARFGGADWILVGVDYEEDEAVFERIQAFGGKQVLLTDLLNDARQAIGLPTGILTPTVDRLKALGVDAHPFVEGASFRVE